MADLLVVAILGIAGYLAFLITVDVPMYVKRWRTETASGSKPLHPLDGLRDVSRRWVVTRDISPFTAVVRIDRGKNDGIRDGMVVVSAQGTLLGTVTK